MTDGDHSKHYSETAREAGLVKASPYAEVEVAGHFARHLVQPLKFDPQRRAGSKELKATVASIIALVEQRETALKPRQRARTAAKRMGFHLAIEAIVCNLAFALGLVSEHTTGLLSVPRGHDLHCGANKIKSMVYGQHFLDALGLMEDPSAEGPLIERVTRGGGFIAGGFRAQGTIRATPALEAMIPPALLRSAEARQWEAFIRAEDDDVLVLKGPRDKDGNRQQLAYRDTAETRRLCKQVRRINACLIDAPLAIALGEGEKHPLAHLDRRSVRQTWRNAQPVDFTRRTVRRIFLLNSPPNHSPWREGGRLYGAFWETMHQEDRFRCLRINGERIANVDLGQLYLRLAYLEKGLTPPQEGDLYDIGGGGLVDLRDPDQRQAIKHVTGAMLMASSPLRNWPNREYDLFPRGKAPPFRDIADAITVKHMPIASLFGTGIGNRLAFIESNILIAALLGLFGRGITALPLHDSVLVAASRAEEAKAVMEVAALSLTGSPAIPVKVDFGEALGEVGLN